MPLRTLDVKAAPKSSVLPIALVFVAVLIGAGLYLKMADEQKKDAVVLANYESERSYGDFRVKAYGMRNQLATLEEWNAWVKQNGHAVCITCNGRGKAQGAECSRCGSFGLEPWSPKK